MPDSSFSPQNPDVRWNSAKTVAVNVRTCIACHTCEALCGDDFRLGETMLDERSEIKAGPTKGANPDSARTAEMACPVDAIKVFDAPQGAAIPAAAFDDEDEPRAASDNFSNEDDLDRAA